MLVSCPRGFGAREWGLGGQGAGAVEGYLGWGLQHGERSLPVLRKLSVPMVIVVVPPDEAQMPRLQRGLEALQPPGSMSQRWHAHVKGLHAKGKDASQGIRLAGCIKSHAVSSEAMSKRGTSFQAGDGRSGEHFGWLKDDDAKRAGQLQGPCNRGKPGNSSLHDL